MTDKKKSVEVRMCKDCRSRQAKDGWCSILKVHVPKKSRKDGINPAENCVHYRRKQS